MRVISLDQTGQQSLTLSVLGGLLARISSMYWQGHSAEPTCLGLYGLPSISSRVQSSRLLRKSLPHLCKYLRNSISDRPWWEKTLHYNCVEATDRQKWQASLLQEIHYHPNQISFCNKFKQNTEKIPRNSLHVINEILLSILNLQIMNKIKFTSSSYVA